MSTSNPNAISQSPPSDDKGSPEEKAKVHSWWDSDFSTAQGVRDALSKGALGALWLSVVLVWAWFNSDAEMKPSLSAEGVGDALTVVLAVGIGPLLAWRIKRGGIIATWISSILLGVLSLTCIIMFFVIPVFHHWLENGFLIESREGAKASFHWLSHHSWEVVQMVVMTLGSLIAFIGSGEGMLGTYKFRGRIPPTWVRGAQDLANLG